jgi:hypothetical protein
LFSEEKINDLNYVSKLNPSLSIKSIPLRKTKSPTFIEKLFYSPKKKTQEELKEELVRYGARLVEYSEESKSSIKKLQKNQFQLKDSIDVEFHKLKK